MMLVPKAAGHRLALRVRRQSTWTPVIVLKNRADRTDREINVGETSSVVQGPAVSALIAENTDPDGSSAVNRRGDPTPIGELTY
jgi:hypothetical protein